MLRTKLIAILEEEFPKESAFIEDFIGLQIEGKEEIKTILLTLDLTLDVISEALEKNVDMIITHHPLIFGERDELIKTQRLLKEKIEILEREKINLFIIHTNSDFNPKSIAFNQALALELEDIEQINENQGIQAKLKKDLVLEEFLDYLENGLELKTKFRTNIFNKKLPIEKIIIGSGASGDLIYNHQYDDHIFIIGELKHHHWVYAHDNNIKIIEIGHQSEKIFKDILEIYLNETLEGQNVKIIKAKENDVYRTI